MLRSVAAILILALATTNALQIDSLPVRNDIVSRRQSLGAIAAFGLAVPASRGARKRRQHVSNFVLVATAPRHPFWAFAIRGLRARRRARAAAPRCAPPRRRGRAHAAPLEATAAAAAAL